MSGALLSSFTPSLMKAEDLEALFVQREELAQRLVALIRESTLTAAKHHHLLIGPRGIGKTHIVALTYYRVQAMEDLRDKLLVAWMREDEWGVTSFLDLLLRIFRALVEEYKDSELEQKVQELYSLSPKEAEHAGAELLKEYVGDRTLLILGENWDDLFNGLGDKGQKRLRSYLQENPFCSILATAQSLFNGVKLQTSPFYGFFHISHLEGLSHEEATYLLTNIAKVSGDTDLASALTTPMGRARVRAVHHLARGNHRVYVIFSQFLTRQSLDELVQPFMKTLDELTPYYQARMQWLSSQQRKIIEFLCDRRSAVTVKEIAQRCFMTPQTASGQLKILREMGYVESQTLGRQSYYELREPLMRLCIEVKKNRGEPIRLLVDFLRFWYSREELQYRLDTLNSKDTIERDYLAYALKTMEEESADPRVEACLKDIRRLIESNKITEIAPTAEELIAIRGEAHDYALLGYGLHVNSHADEALTACEKALELDPTSVFGWAVRGYVLGESGSLEEALASFEKATLLAPSLQDPWEKRGRVLSELGRFDEALQSYEKSLEIDSNDSASWLGKGQSLRELGDFEEAVRALDRALEINPNEDMALWFRSGVLNTLGCHEAAVADCKRAIKLHEEKVSSEVPGMMMLHYAVSLVSNDMWEDGLKALRGAMKNILNDANAQETLPYASSIIIQSLLETGAPEKLPERINQLTEIFSRAQVLHEEFARPLRLLDTAIRYLETKDGRVLLELPVEERDLLKPLLAKGEGKPQAEISVSKKPKKRQTPSRGRRRKRAVSPARQAG